MHNRASSISQADSMYPIRTRYEMQLYLTMMRSSVLAA